MVAKTPLRFIKAVTTGNSPSAAIHVHSWHSVKIQQNKQNTLQKEAGSSFRARKAQRCYSNAY